MSPSRQQIYFGSGSIMYCARVSSVAVTMGIYASSMLVFLLVLTAFSICVPLAHAETLRNRRPADFYRLRLSTDANVCREVTASLNKGHVLVPDQMTVDGPNMVTELFLQSDLQVPWKRKGYSGPGGLPSTLEYVPVDIANNGHAQMIYRETVFSAHIWSNMLFIDSATPAELESNMPLSMDALRRIEGYKKSNLGEEFTHYVTIDQETAPGIYNQISPQSLIESPLEYDVNLIQVDQRIYLIVTDARAADYLMHGRGGPIAVFVIAYRSPRDLAVVCELRSRKKLRRTRPSSRSGKPTRARLSPRIRLCQAPRRAGAGP